MPESFTRAASSLKPGLGVSLRLLNRLLSSWVQFIAFARLLRTMGLSRGVWGQSARTMVWLV